MDNHTSLHQRFLLLCLRGRWASESVTEARELSATHALDWLLLGRLAVHEGVAPLLYASVRGQGLAPAWFEQELKQVYDLNATRNLRLLHELTLVLEQLERAQIAAIVLKGAALAETLYGNFALRPMFDLDLLVRREALPRAMETLAAVGYTMATVEPYEGAALENENEILLHKRGVLDVALELHWSLIDSPFYQQAAAMDWFWQTSQPAHIGGRQSLVLGPEAQLIHLCAHLALHHRGKGLLWLHDVASLILIGGKRLNWDELVTRTAALDLALPVRHVLSQVTEDWSVPVPPIVLQQLNALQPSQRAAQIYIWSMQPVRPVAVRFWADLGSMTGWRARLRYAWHNLFPSTTYMKHRYAVSKPLLLPLYYPLRWLKGIGGLLRLAGGKEAD